MSDTIYPPSASASGKNAYYLGNCKTVGHAPAYAACLHKLQSGSGAECSSAARAGECQAANMKREEELQGKALYFIPRESLPTAKTPAWSVPNIGQTKTIKTAPIGHPLVDGGSYADAINAAVTSSAPAAAVVPVKPAVPAPSVNPGESPIEYARRVAALRNSNQENQ